MKITLENMELAFKEVVESDFTTKIEEEEKKRMLDEIEKTVTQNCKDFEGLTLQGLQAMAAYYISFVAYYVWQKERWGADDDNPS